MMATIHQFFQVRVQQIFSNRQACLLGILGEAKFNARTVAMPTGAKLLMFTDGLPDGIGGQAPEQRICDTLESDKKETMLALRDLIDPKFNEDDVTVLLLVRQPSCELRPDTH